MGLDSLDPVAHHKMILQESPDIGREDSWLEWTKESSADHIDSSRRIRSCLPRTPGQWFSIMLADMLAQDLQSSHRLDRWRTWV